MHWSIESGNGVDLRTGASATLRAIVPPTLSSPQPRIGHSAAESNPQIPTICAPITGQFSDVCTQPRSSIVRVRVYDYPSNALIEERELQDGACITPSPWRMDWNMSNADYEVEWRAVDGWGNWSTVRHWRGWFSASTPVGACSYGTSVHTLWDY